MVVVIRTLQPMIKFYLVATAILVLLLLLEYLILRRAVRRIPYRILVNGSRGKSTTVKIIYRIFNTAGWRTFAKTTGDAPEMFYPDGTTRVLKRFAPGRITENIRWLINIARQKPRAVVLECMALHPETQHTLARRLFQANSVLITNVTVDHQEIMGDSKSKIARTLFECVPKVGEVFLPSDFRKYNFSPEWDTHNYHFVDSVEYPEHFSHIPTEIINNSWLLIRSFTEFLSISEEIVRQVFQSAWESIDQNIRFKSAQFNWEFFPLFSINDPETAAYFVEYLRREHPDGQKEIALVNLRSDRPLRTARFVEFTGHYFPHAELWLAGSGKHLFLYRWKKRFPELPLPELLDFAEALRLISRQFPQFTRIYGLANHRGADGFLNRIKELV